jgi:hypothetical protein
MNQDWRFISRLVVRRTGFPLEPLLDLAMTNSITAIDQLLTKEDEISDAGQMLLRSFHAEVQNCYDVGDKEGLKILSKARQQLGKGYVRPEQIDNLCQHFAATDFGASMRRYRELLKQGQSLRVEAEAIFAKELWAKRCTLRKTFQDPWKQEAVFTSNPDAFNNGFHEFLSNETLLAKRTARTKALERRYMSYLQRFCAKNDTASFFGPMNYGALGQRHDEPVRLTMEEGKMRGRKVFYSFWMVAALAEAMAQEADIQDCLKPRLHPLWRLDGKELALVYGDETLPLSPRTLALLRQLDGTLSRAEVRAASADPQVFDKTLDMLLQKGIIQLTIPLPSTIFDPFSFLERFVAALPDGLSAKTRWSIELDSFRNLIAQLPTTHLAQRQLLCREMEERFTALTGQAARRLAGKTYADRTLFYEECDGTIAELSFNAAFTTDLRQRLALVFELLGTYGQLLNRYYQKIAQRAFAQLSDGRPAMPYGAFIQKLEALLDLGQLDMRDPTLEAFVGGLTRLIAVHADKPVVRLEHEDLVFLLGEDNPNLGLHTSPDLMFAAKDLEALARGDYRLVLGEVHQFLAMWGSQLLFDRQREAVEHETERCLDLLPNYAGLATILNTRRHKGLLNESFPGTFIELLGHPSDRSRDVVAIRDLEVCDTGSELELRLNKSDRRLAIYNSGDDKLHLWAFAVPRVTSLSIHLPGHTPRIEISGVVQTPPNYVVVPNPAGR